MTESHELRRTALHELHVELDGRLVDFAGWELPIHYRGVVAEHEHTRAGASLFDVGHMAVVEIRGDDPGASLERISPAAITTLASGRQRYALLTNDDGGIIDDCMVANWGDHLTLVVNASRADVDIAHLTARLTECEVVVRDDLCLLALQGPATAGLIERLAPDLADTVFLDVRESLVGNIPVAASRSGYTGEDGFELAVSSERAIELARVILAEHDVMPAGLGARDTLRLEAGLHLYGNDLDETISPLEAGLGWSVPARRRENLDFSGSERFARELADGTARVRVGLVPTGKRPVRDGCTLRSDSGGDAGIVTSGGYGPTVKHPVAIGLVPPQSAIPGSILTADVRGNEIDCTVVDLPFVPHRYRRR